jgi:hypothetical protein
MIISDKSFLVSALICFSSVLNWGLSSPFKNSKSSSMVLRLLQSKRRCFCSHHVFKCPDKEKTRNSDAAEDPRIYWGEEGLGEMVHHRSCEIQTQRV